MASLPDVASQDGSLGFTRGLMKTWHFTNFWQILLGCQLAHKQIKILKKKCLMTCSHRMRRWKVLPEKQNPNEQTNSWSHWAWAHDHWGYWKLSLHSGSVPKSLLLHLRGPTYFCWHGTRMVSWGEVTSRCVENNIILTLMSAAPFLFSYGFAALPWLRVPLLAFPLGWFLPWWHELFIKIVLKEIFRCLPSDVGLVPLLNMLKLCRNNQHLRMQAGNSLHFLSFQAHCFLFSISESAKWDLP